MPATVTCPTCSVTWFHVPSIGKATSHSAPAAPLTRLPDDGGPVWGDTWRCVCGRLLAATTPAFDVVPCRQDAAPGGVCRKAEGNKTVLGSLGYTRSGRDGGSWQACSCCGHQGSHLVLRDPAAPRPACLSVPATL